MCRVYPPTERPIDPCIEHGNPTARTPKGIETKNFHSVRQPGAAERVSTHPQPPFSIARGNRIQGVPFNAPDNITEGRVEQSFDAYGRKQTRATTRAKRLHRFDARALCGTAQIRPDIRTPRPRPQRAARGSPAPSGRRTPRMPRRPPLPSTQRGYARQACSPPFRACPVTSSRVPSPDLRSPQPAVAW